MILLSKKLSIGVASLLTVASPLAAFEAESENHRRRLAPPDHVTLPPSANIANQIRTQNAQGRQAASFTINANRAGGAPGQQVASFNVHRATSAVVPGAVITTSTGTTHTVQHGQVNTILVTDSPNTIGLIAVNTETGTTHGIIASNSAEGTDIQISQNHGEEVSKSFLIFYISE